MLRDFFSFLHAIWDEWKTLLTGGSIIAGIAIWGLATGQAPPQWISWLVLGLTLILAAFFSWRKEWVAGNRGFIDITPEQLSQLCRGRTSVQAAAMIKPYMGKSITIKSILDEVTTIAPFMTIVSLRDSKHVDSMLVTFWVPFWQRKVFMPLQRGMLLTVAGRIGTVELYNVRLKSPMLLKIEDPL